MTNILMDFCTIGLPKTASLINFHRQAYEAFSNKSSSSDSDLDTLYRKSFLELPLMLIERIEDFPDHLLFLILVSQSLAQGLSLSIDEQLSPQDIIWIERIDMCYASLQDTVRDELKRKVLINDLQSASCYDYCILQAMLLLDMRSHPKTFSGKIESALSILEEAAGESLPFSDDMKALCPKQPLQTAQIFPFQPEL